MKRKAIGLTLCATLFALCAPVEAKRLTWLGHQGTAKTRLKQKAVAVIRCLWHSFDVASATSSLNSMDSCDRAQMQLVAYGVAVL